MSSVSLASGDKSVAQPQKKSNIDKVSPCESGNSHKLTPGYPYQNGGNMGPSCNSSLTECNRQEHSAIYPVFNTPNRALNDIKGDKWDEIESTRLLATLGKSHSEMQQHLRKLHQEKDKLKSLVQGQTAKIECIVTEFNYLRQMIGTGNCTQYNTPLCTKKGKGIFTTEVCNDFSIEKHFNQLLTEKVSVDFLPSTDPILGTFIHSANNRSFDDIHSHFYTNFYEMIDYFRATASTGYYKLLTIAYIPTLYLIKGALFLFYPLVILLQQLFKSLYYPLSTLLRSTQSAT